MNNLSPSLPYDTVDYLKTPEEISAYLDAVIDEGDEQLLLAALQDAIRAARRIMPIEVSGVPGKGDDLGFEILVLLLHNLGYEISLRHRKVA